MERHENYGITHTIKHVFVDEKKKPIIKVINLSADHVKYRFKRTSLGYQPLANNLLSKNEKVNYIH